MNNENLVVGIDIGGSHITAAIIDLNNRLMVGDLLIRRKVDCHAPAEEIITIWIDTIKELLSNFNEKVFRIGFAMPGPFLYDAGISKIRGFDKYEALYDLNIRNIIAERLGLQASDILFRNDAEAFLDGEIFCGAAKGCRDVIGITLGTGLGSAVSHHCLTKDAELSVLDFNGEIIEESVSTRGLLRNYFNLTGKMLKDAKDVANLFLSDDNAVKSFEKFGDDLAWFLRKFIQQENPEILVIGGNIIQSWDLFMDRVLQNLTTVLSQVPRIVKASLGENAALIGGACKHEEKLSAA
ncbi:ROK family protein [Arachidicoccus sp.]|uniref:ROK family protein n=1 Tax=Arachidicoccus sp. TaxID=1872624 RepID=UPI003D224043